VLIASARVTVRAVPLGTVSMVRARGAGVGADGVGAAAGARRDSAAAGCFSGSRLVLGGLADFVV